MRKTVRLLACLTAVAALTGCGLNQNTTSSLPALTLPQRPTIPNPDFNALLAKDLAILPLNITSARGVTIVRQRKGKRHQPVVVFLHGWGSVDARLYGPWIAHLARDGYTVLFPTYQDRHTKPSQILRTSLAGIRNGLKFLRQAGTVKPGPVVVVGHSAGAMLSADYAAVAAKQKLPPAKAVFAFYPGVKLPAWPDAIPVSDMTAIPASTSLTVYVGSADATVGEGTGRMIYTAAPQVTNRRLVVVTAPVLNGHVGPMFTDTQAQHTFWSPVDTVLGGAAGAAR
jgi:acetyl esterase/lipase